MTVLTSLAATPLSFVVNYGETPKPSPGLATPPPLSETKTPNNQIDQTPAAKNAAVTSAPTAVNTLAISSPL
jgi:hypothetical protein